MVERLHEDAGDRLQIVGISSEEEEVLRPFLLRSTTTYTIARDELGSSKLDYEVKSLPTVVLIDSDGSILAWDYGLGGVRRTVAAARSLLKLTP